MIINPFKEKYQKYLDIDLNEIPEEIVELSINRVMDFKKNPEPYLSLDNRKDIISFFLLCQSLALSPKSQKCLQTVNILKKTIWKRLERNPTISDMSDLVDITPSNLKGEDRYRLLSMKGLDPERYDLYMLDWDTVYDIINPISEYIFRGKLHASKYDIAKIYVEVLGKKTQRYIESISKSITNANLSLHKKIFNSVRFYTAPVKVTEELSSNKFPPCVNEALKGVSAGARNYAITVFLTSFLSYARIFPSTRIFDRNFNVDIHDKEIEIIIDEIIPLIFEAGSRCDPPFFKDQPIEKQNVIYHLGFGLTSSPTVKGFGKSKWYLPPSCSKIQENVPSLCKADSFCRKRFYQYADKTKASNLIKAAKKRNKKGLGEKILEALGKNNTVKELSSELNVPKGEIRKQLNVLVKREIVSYRRITNPLVYYIRRKQS
ncbi:MAG: hypothetical protein U9N35_05200 [Euryarchaeota archaeon]|nr:hypothetical protein [Euryarchaeota archaeon]